MLEERLVGENKSVFRVYQPGNLPVEITGCIKSKNSSRSLSSEFRPYRVKSLLSVLIS